jgi:prepilin-type N-terminal cleavage/methylation domain-containing protein
MRPAHGFTLIEITVTLAILGVVLSIVYGVFSQTVAGKELAERRGDEAASARAVLARIARDLEAARPMSVAALPAAPAVQATPGSGAPPTPTPGASAIPPQRGLFLGRVRTEDGVPLDDLAFTTIVRRPSALTFAGSDLGIVHYFVAPVSENSRVGGLFRETLYALNGDSFDPDQVNPGSGTLILAGVTALDFRFYDGTDWGEEWDSRDARNFAPAPLAVEITLGVADDEGHVERYATSVDVPLARGLKNPQLARPGAGPTPTGAGAAGAGPI